MSFRIKFLLLRWLVLCEDTVVSWSKLHGSVEDCLRLKKKIFSSKKCAVKLKSCLCLSCVSPLYHFLFNIFLSFKWTIWCFTSRLMILYMRTFFVFLSHFIIKTQKQIKPHQDLEKLSLSAQWKPFCACYASMVIDFFSLFFEIIVKGEDENFIEIVIYERGKWRVAWYFWGVKCSNKSLIVLLVRRLFCQRS